MKRKVDDQSFVPTETCPRFDLRLKIHDVVFAYMCIQLTIRAAGLNIVANLRDEALASIIKLVQDNLDDSAPTSQVAPTADISAVVPAIGNAGALMGQDSEQATKNSLKTHGAGELLNRLKWDTFPEKILLLAAWHESRGGGTPWRSSDMDGTFRQAKESAPKNFPRDIKNAIVEGWIHAETPRTYTVTRSGWNKIAHALDSTQS